MLSNRNLAAALTGELLASSLLILQAQAPPSLHENASALFRDGKIDQAERVLRAGLANHPNDAWARGLLGVVLDSQQRYEEAEKEYRRALALAPGSPSLLNNLGNHYMAQGKFDQARTAFSKVVAAAPRHSNANLQLARISVGAGRGSEALKHLGRLPTEDQSKPPVGLLRAQALRLTNRADAAEQLLRAVDAQAGNDPRVAFSVGMAYVQWEKYAEAEAAFARALEAEPSNFDTLFNLGLAARRAHHLDRALSVFQVALQQRPNDADCLLNLANVYSDRGQPDQAIVLLLQAHNSAPSRPDILYALAFASQEMGFYADAANAIDKYLRIKPHDDVARRERGFCYVRSARLDEGLKDLQFYVMKYPKDARGLYELAIGETVRDRDRALQHLNQALELDPNLIAARYARAIVYYQKSRFRDSVRELELVLKAEPQNYQAWDALGQDYLRLDRPQEALDALSRAAEIAPKDAKVLMHYSRALLRVGRRDDSERVIETFKRLGPAEGRRQPFGGLFDFLQLPPAEQLAKYTLNLQKSISTRPEDPGLRVRLGKALLAEGRIHEAIEALRAARGLTSDSDTLAACGRALLDRELYDAAREFLDPVVLKYPVNAAAHMDLAISMFHTKGAESALAELEKIPPDKRAADWYLLRAQILDSLGRREEALHDLNLGLRTDLRHPELHLQAALFLIKHQRYPQAADMLAQALRLMPGSPDLMLTQAITLELLQQHDQAQELLHEIQSGWPEWSLPYLVNGIIFESRLESAQARPLLEIAVALGAHEAIAYYYLALAITHAAPDDLESAQEAISAALKLDPDDAYIHSLAGKIAYARKDFPVALEHLEAALRLWPEMIEAHMTLAGVYRALGEKEKSAGELQAVLRIKQTHPAPDQAPPFPTGDLLLSVRPLAHAAP